MTVKSFIRFSVLSLAITFAAHAFAAEDASMHEVYLAAEAGKFSEAQAMMDKVLHDHPDSAKAHYVEAELLAKQGRFSAAADELNTAERLKPGLPFAKPQALQKLRAQVSSSHASFKPANSQVPHADAGNSMPWGFMFLALGLIAFIYFVAKKMTQANQPMNGYAGGAYSANPQPYANPAAPAGGVAPGIGSGMGSGILGGLVTGAALGAGMVAGEALMHHFTDGEHGSSNGNGLVNEAQAHDNSPTYDDMGGSDFGIADSSSWDDSSSGDDWT